MRKRIISLFMTICMTAMLMPSSALPVRAQTTRTSDWNGQNTVNLIPVMYGGESLNAVGWGNVGDQINQYAQTTGGFANAGIQAKNTSDDIGNADYSGGVFWRIDFSDADKVKINKGDLSLSASAKYWFQASSQHHISLRYEFFNAGNASTGSQRATYDHYYVTQHNRSLELNNITIPQNTAYVQIWFSNHGTLLGRPFIGEISAYLTDTTAPAVAGNPREYSVNDNTEMPPYALPGDTTAHYGSDYTASCCRRIGLSRRTGTDISSRVIIPCRTRAVIWSIMRICPYPNIIGRIHGTAFHPNLIYTRHGSL